MIAAALTDTEKWLRGLGLEHFEIDEGLGVITISDHEEFISFKGLVDPGAEVTSWGDDDDEFSGNSFRFER